MGRPLNCLTTFFKKVKKSWLFWPIFLRQILVVKKVKNSWLFWLFCNFLVKALIFHPDDSNTLSQSHIFDCERVDVLYWHSQKSQEFLTFLTFLQFSRRSINFFIQMIQILSHKVISLIVNMLLYCTDIVKKVKISWLFWLLYNICQKF